MVFLEKITNGIAMAHVSLTCMASHQVMEFPLGDPNGLSLSLEVLVRPLSLDIVRYQYGMRYIFK
jgi:hypothetical protein